MIKIDKFKNKLILLYKEKKFIEVLNEAQKLLLIYKDNLFLYNTIAKCFCDLFDYDKAVQYYKKVILLDANNLEANNNLGNILQMQGKYTEAIPYYKKAIVINPNSFQVYKNLGKVYEERKEFSDAIICYEEVIRINPDMPYIYAILIHAKLMNCDWNNLDNLISEIVSENKILKLLHPYVALFVFSNLSVIDVVTRIYINNNNKYSNTDKILSNTKKNKNTKIKIAYFSSDFRVHPVSQLLIEVLELHDKSKFEIIALSFNLQKEDYMTQRTKNAVDRFIDLKNRSIKEIVLLSQDLNIDIAIDLNGLTENTKSEIFSHRIAPVQVNYLGYPSTMGTDYHDYIIADKIVIPQSSKKYYSEKIAYLPNSFQPNDRQRVVGEKNFTRSELGLPEKGFVFCCFNNIYKINPRIFDTWMKILKETSGSVLWLKVDNQHAQKNLQKEAVKRGIDQKRLIFAKRMDSFEDHLARYKVADLFLDTIPFNAHTTASEALWAGLPILTTQAESYISRVTSSLLSAIGLPELITINLDAYCSLAIDLAHDVDKLKLIKSKLIKNRLTSSLFDTPRYVQDIEKLYFKMHERYKNNLAADDIEILY